jgi:hypothetical protein
MTKPAPDRPTTLNQVREEGITKALFGLRERHPYYIVAPRYISTSAGILVLYRMCHMLNVAGEDAYIVLDHGASVDMRSPPGLHAPLLTTQMAEFHRQQGRAPIVIYSETATVDLGTGLVVRYMMNFVGLLTGPKTLPPADYVVAYSSRLAEAAPRCDQILYLPMSDPDYWSPDPAAKRTHKCVYLGKYVDFHGGTIDKSITDGAVIITRDKPDSQTREELRQLLRTATCLYVFENTAVATEAALVGCPIICIANPHFNDLLSGGEIGSDGFTFDDTPEGLAHAAANVGKFRERYLRTIEAVGPGMIEFIERTQALAGSKTAGPVNLPQLAGLATIDRVWMKARSLTVSVHQIGWLETFRRGSLGLLRRLTPRRRW